MRKTKATLKASSTIELPISLEWNNEVWYSLIWWSTNKN